MSILNFTQDGHDYAFNTYWEEVYAIHRDGQRVLLGTVTESICGDYLDFESETGEGWEEFNSYEGDMEKIGRRAAFLFTQID